MYQGKTVFSQLMSYVSKYQFNKIVDKYHGNYKVRNFSCWDQFLSLSFAQLTYRESLRDIEACLQAQSHKQYHIGLRSRVNRSTLADANESRDWRIYADFAQILISEAVKLYADEELSKDFRDTAYALDSSTIDLCLSLFPWAKFRKNKGAIKLHTLMDIRGSIPTFIEITDGLVHDVNILDVIVPEPGSYYIMDRGYIDFKRLHKFTENAANFIIRARKNFKFKRLYSLEKNKTIGVKCDQIVKLSGFYPSRFYPEKIRRIKFYDSEKDSQIVILTNNFSIAASTVAELFRNRWKIELFFKWIKQHLRIKAFYGTSNNAVKTQIWIAISI
jgi:transposase